MRWRVCGLSRRALDPFEPNRRIEDKLGAIYELAHPRLSPSRGLLPSQSLTR